jgi:hypothetical protein
LFLEISKKGGQYWIEMMDKFSSGWAVLIIGFFEFICIGYVYGFRNFHKDIRLMIGSSCNNQLCYWYWNVCWLFVSPALILVIVVVSWVQYKPLETDGYVFPVYSNVIGWLMTASVLLGMFGWAFYLYIDAMFIRPRSLWTLVRPEKDWGPRSTRHKNLATHLPNLENFHDSKRRMKDQSSININTINMSYT